MIIAWGNIAEGDKKAYSDAYLVFYNKLYNYGVNFTPEVAIVEDAIQETLLSIWTLRDKLPSINNPAGYFFLSFRNNLFAKLKKLHRKIAIEQVDWEPEFAREAIIIKEETSKELQDKLRKAMNELTSRQREAIYFRFYEGMSYEEVANVMNISVKASYKIVARALVELRQSLSVPMSILLILLRMLK